MLFKPNAMNCHVSAIEWSSEVQGIEQNSVSHWVCVYAELCINIGLRSDLPKNASDDDALDHIRVFACSAKPFLVVSPLCQLPP